MCHLYKHLIINKCFVEFKKKKKGEGGRKYNNRQDMKLFRRKSKALKKILIDR